MVETISDQLDREKRSVAYDVYDMTVRQLIDMVASETINVAPDYQRHFVWDPERESELIESILLGIPVPSLYMAANRDGRWEVVDGVQRLSTLLHFTGAADQLLRLGKAKPLVLTGLKRLTLFNDLTFDKMPQPNQLYFLLRPLRVTTLNDRSDFGVRYDLFERLNTGGVKLHDQEIRNSVFRGRFRDLIGTLAVMPEFRTVVKLPKNEQASASYEECVLRFFAFSERYEMFDHSVGDFLNDYMQMRVDALPPSELINRFETTMKVAAASLPNGIVRGSRNQTPLNLYEAVAVGLGLAIAAGQQIHPERLPELMQDEELRGYTTGATNSRRMVTSRINFIRDGL